MKKFISMVMAAAMVVSLVPATAFAKGDVTATAKVVDAADLTEDDSAYISYNGAPELQIKVTDADYQDTDNTGKNPTMDVTVTLDGAEFRDEVDNNNDVLSVAQLLGNITITSDDKTEGVLFNGNAVKEGSRIVSVTIDPDDVDEEEFTFTIEGFLAEDDVIAINLESVLDKVKEGHEATVSVDSDMVEATDLVYAAVLGLNLKMKVKDTVDVAEEEKVELEKVTIEAVTGNLPSDDDQKDLKLKLSNGFEFVKNEINSWVVSGGSVYKIDGDEAWINLTTTTDKITITGIWVEADTASEGAVATMKVTATDWEAASAEVATVVGEGLTISVDEDEDVPEMWSGVAVENSVLTDDDDNKALEFTIEETVAGAFSEKDEVELVLPEGVIVTDVDVTPVAGDPEKDVDWDEALFAEAYREGDHKSFVFDKRTINETVSEAYELDVVFTVIAVPSFVGDVTVEMLVDGESVGEVTIATFKTPVVVEASANDLIIDYRHTEVPTDIVVKEAEAGLWAEDFWVSFGIDRFDEEPFEDDMEYAVNEESDMEISGEDKELKFTVDEESDDEAAVVTISNISLYMQRNIPAGAYDLTMDYNGSKAFYGTQLFAADCEEVLGERCDCDKTDAKGCVEKDTVCDGECVVVDVYDVEDVVKEGFVNVVTAGRDADDASFTTKVVVPVGESYIVAGENTVALDVPAYVSASGYTMLPVRAVAVALGILNNNVLWDQASKTVTILYGQRIITMTVGAKVINVNGSAIPASSSPEVVDGRTFLPMRDLATALGVTDITWDAATKTATLNGNK